MGNQDANEAGERAAVIRPVRAEDADGVNQLRRQPSVLANTLSLPSERVAMNRRFLEALTPDDHVFVAEVGGQIAGMAGLHVRGGKMRHCAELGISIHDDFQGRGLGRALMETLLDLADNYLGLKRVELEVFADNLRAIHLYERLDFQHEGRKRAGAYRGGAYVDVLVMGRLR